jgi:5'-deoxy-5'-methylthioadenosine phosphorylase
MNVSLAVIGGTGLNAWPDFDCQDQHTLDTPFGAPSAPILLGTLKGLPVAFLARHGEGHKLPPHAINYRANLWALHHLGIKTVIGMAAVGGIASWFEPATLAVPHDVIDYTYGRQHTFSDGSSGHVDHIEFSQPYTPRLREGLIRGAMAAGIHVAEAGVLGVTQGPRLETPAEIKRLLRDGCDMVGMTGLPEAALARELGMGYACLAVSVNWAAGVKGLGDIHAEIEQSLTQGMAKARQVLLQALPLLLS